MIPVVHGLGDVVKTITAITHDEKEFFRVINWAYDQEGLGAILSALAEGGVYQLKVTLPDADERLGGLADEVSAQDFWTVSVSPAAGTH